ncbi:MAG TPA: protein kinase [Drouetiella sp.]
MDDSAQISTNGPSFGRLSETYRFSGQIGAGGMGVIYRAHHAMLKKDVAIKILHQVNEMTVQRFQREAQAAYNLHHENVVAVHEFGVTDEGQPFMVMEFIQGKTLASVIDERGALPLDLCVKIFKQVCSGVAHAHSRGVLHRDLKPSNIMLTDPDSWNPQVRIVDFGIAKVLDMAEDDTSTGKLTRTGDFVGSPLYMSPEQCLGKNIDLRSDIYSIGCIMYETLTGRAPFIGGTSMEIMLRQMNDLAPTLKEGGGGTSYPAWIERLVARALAKDPNKRFQNVEEMKKALEERVVAEVKASSANKSAPRFSKPVVLAGALLVLSVVAFGAFALLSPRGEKPHEKMPSEQLAAQFPDLKIDKNKKVEKGAESYDDITSDPTVLTAPLHDEIVERSVADRLQTEISSQGQTLSDSALYGLKDRVDIKSLLLSGANISDKALRYARHLPLVKVELNYNPKITDKVLAYLNPETLEELSLSHTGFKSAGLPALSKFKNLRTLNLSSDGIDERDLPVLANCANLISLDLSNNLEIYDAACQTVARLTKLRSLNLGTTRIDGRGLIAFKTLKELKALDLNGSKVEDSGVVSLQNLPLSTLELQMTAITDGAIKAIAKMKTLRELGFQRVPLSLDSIKLISTLPLNKLILYNCDITNADLEALSHTRTLRELHLSGNQKISAEGLKLLSGLPIQELVLQKVNISDADLDIFADWKNLRNIDLSKCPGVTSAGAERLKKSIGHDLSVFPFDEPIIKNINFGSPF